MKACGGSGGIALHWMEVNGQLNSPSILFPWKGLPSNSRLEGELSGSFGEEKNLFLSLPVHS
jgi:hypothetical protein